MNKSICSLHDSEEEKYICVHPTCLKKVDNKLCCIQCNLSNHNKRQLNDHQFMNISELEKIALSNYSKLKEHQENEIEKNTQLRTKTEERLSAVLLSLSTWQNNQKKMFNDITENSSQVLAQNIIKAQNLMKNPSLDTYIYFYKLNLLDKQNENLDIRDQSMRQLQYQLNQIEMKRDILINQINFIQREYFLSFAQMDYQIELDNLNNYQFENCEKHLSQKEVLCTHPNCLQSNPLQLQCSLCITQYHKEHQQQDYIKTIATVMKEQEEKKELIEQLKKKFNQDIKKSIDMNLLKINESQQNYYQNNEKQKEKAVFLEQQQLSEFLNPVIPNYIFGHLDQNLLTKTKEQINLYYQQLYHNYEIKFSNIFSNQVKNDLEFCTQLDFNSKKFYQYVIHLEQELELRSLKLKELQRTIQTNTFNHEKIEEKLNTQNDSINNFHLKIEKEIANLQSLTQTNQKEQYNSIKDLNSNVVKTIPVLQSFIQTHSDSQNVSIKNLQQNLEKSIAGLSSTTKTNLDQQQISIYSLQQNLEKSIAGLSSTTKTNLDQQQISIYSLQQNLEKLIAGLSSMTKTNSEQQNVQLKNLQQHLEKANTNLQQTLINSDSQNVSIKNLQQNFEKSIACLSSTTKTNLDQQQISIYSLQQNLEKLIAGLSSMMKTNSEQQNVQLKNLQQHLEKANTNLQQTLINSDSQNVSIKNLQQNFEKSIAGFSSTTNTNSDLQYISIQNLQKNLEKLIVDLPSKEEQNISIYSLKYNLEKSISDLSSMTKINSEQQKDQIKNLEQNLKKAINALEFSIINSLINSVKIFKKEYPKIFYCLLLLFFLLMFLIF